MNCDKCGQPLAPEDRFCPECGTEQAVTAVPAAAPEGEVMCSGCGAPNPPYNLFCEQCGQPLPPPALAPELPGLAEAIAPVAALPPAPEPAPELPGLAEAIASAAALPPAPEPEPGPAAPEAAPAGSPCPTCGATNRLGARFCLHCGQALAAPAGLPGEPAAETPEAAPEPEGPIPAVAEVEAPTAKPEEPIAAVAEVEAPEPAPPPIVCPSCGQENRAAARFCWSCGRPFGAAPEPAPPAGEPRAVEKPPAAGEAEPLPAGPIPPEVEPALPAGEPFQARVEPAGPIAGSPGGEEGPAIEPGMMEVEHSEALPPDEPATNTCPVCGMTNRPQAAFCIVCGQRLPAAAASVLLRPAPALDGGPHFGADLAANASPEAEALEQRIEEAEPAVPVEEAAPQPCEESAGPPPPPLEVGSLIAGRYQVVAVLAPTETANEYGVADLQRCWACDWPVEDATQLFCNECGAEIRQPSPERRLKLREVTAPAGGTIVDGERAYTPVTPEPLPAASPFPFGVRLSVGQASDAGVVRNLDEDSVLAVTLTGLHEGTVRPAIGLFAVADGIGGYEGGEWASRLAVQTLAEQLLSGLIVRVASGEDPLPLLKDAVEDHLLRAISTANERILCVRTSRQSDMGTTLTLALVLDSQVHIANVGDSRTYLWGQNGLEQITTDHSLIASLIASGMAQPEEIYTHPQRSAIYRSLGDKPQVAIDFFSRELAPGNVLVLCCDGLWEMVHNEGIEEVLLQGLPPQATCDELVRRANRAGGEDNISVIVVQVGQPGPAAAHA